MKFAVVFFLSTIAVFVEGKLGGTEYVPKDSMAVAGLEEEIKEDQADLDKLATEDGASKTTKNEVAFLESEIEEAKQELAELGGGEDGEEETEEDLVGGEDGEEETEEVVGGEDGEEETEEVVGDEYDEDGEVRSRNLQTCSKEKRVKIVKFGINGDDDSGAFGEHQLTLDGKRYFPIQESDCHQDPIGFCEWREGLYHEIGSKSAWVKFTLGQQLTVGTEEHDTTSENDSYSGILTSSQWYIDTCAPYEITVAKNFKPEISREFCLEGKVSATAGSGPVSATAEVGAKSCSSWVDPAESYIWVLRIEPWEQNTRVVAPVIRGNGSKCSKSNECSSNCCSSTVGGANTCEVNKWWRKCVR